MRIPAHTRPGAHAARRLAVAAAALALLALAVLALARPPGAEAAVAGSVEPPYTRTTGSNAFWWNWTAVQGIDGAGNANYAYYLCFRTSANGALVEDSNHTNGPGSANCTTSLVGGPWATPPSGAYGVYPLGGGALADGAHYSVCATGAYLYTLLWRSDLVSSNACPQTVIDRSRPSVQVAVNGSQQYTSNPRLDFTIAYSDAVSPPWPANYRCIKIGAACGPADQFAYDPNCSVPQNGTSRINGFACSGDFTNQPDGRVFFCAAAADSAIPDNAGNPNQFAYPDGRPVTSDTANISDIGCGSVVLDRAPPEVRATASSASVRVGDPVRLSASATDATSGVSSAYSWTFGDGAPGATGPTATHSYGRPGTFVARVSTRDQAGNPATGSVTVTVREANGGGGGGEGGGGGTVGGGGSAGTGSQAVVAGGLRVTAPRRFRLARGRQALRVALVPRRPGTVALALVRGRRVLSASTLRLSGTSRRVVALRLPRPLTGGPTTLRVRFVPAGGRPVTRSLRVVLVAPPAARRGAPRARADASLRVSGGPRHGAPPPRRSGPIAVDPA